MKHLILVFAVIAATVSGLGGCASRLPPGVVAADHPLASEAGAEMLRRGGNAVDAAVASSLALSVVRPYSCGLGGGGFMVIHLENDPRHGTVDVALNYRETCPSGVGPGYYAGVDDPDASRVGGRAVAVPGTVAGLMHALEHYGTLDRAEVFAPAIRLAEQGWAVDDHHALASAGVRTMLDRSDEMRGRFGFVWETLTRRGEIAVGDRLVNPQQARALRLIAEQGAEAFYGGEIGEALVASVRADGGVLTRQDLLAYRVEETEPVRTAWRGKTLVCMPPPSSGGIAIAQLFALVDRLNIDLPATGLPEPADAHLLIESMKHAFADRARHMADPRFSDLPIDAMLSDANLDRAALSIEPGVTHAPDHYGVAPVPPVDGGTSHISVVDRYGNAVACTETINTLFGSRLAVEGFGFCLNNEMDDFTTVAGALNAYGLQQSEANLPEPGKRPLSSMSPTVVLDERGRVEAVAGASGGPRIITATAQVLLRVLLSDASAEDAVAAPRLHHQWRPDAVYTETWSGEAPPAVWVGALESIGHTVRTRREVGVCQLVRRAGPVDERANGRAAWDAASDPRKGGTPAWE